MESRVLSFHPIPEIPAIPGGDLLESGVLVTDDFQGHEEHEHSTIRASSTSIDELMSPIRPYLDDPRVLELVINRPGEICAETNQGWRIIKLEEMDFDRCFSLARAIATATEQSISEKAPLLSATMPSEERVQIVLPPCVEAGFVSYTFRKPSKRIWTLDDFERQGVFGTGTTTKQPSAGWDPMPVVTQSAVRLHVDGPEQVRENARLLHPFEIGLLRLLWSGRISEFLRQSVRLRRTMVVAGKTGSGKTTFMKGVMQEVSRAERIVTIEDSREIFLPSHPNKVHLLYSKGGQGVASVSPSNLLVACLRMKPDRILLAEVREGECYDFLRVAASGHPGSITSIHAGTCLEAFEQMGLMIRQSPAGAGLAHSETQRLLKLLVDTIVAYSNDGPRRWVSEIYYRPLLKQQTATQ